MNLFLERFVLAGLASIAAAVIAAVIINQENLKPKQRIFRVVATLLVFGTAGLYVAKIASTKPGGALNLPTGDGSKAGSDALVPPKAIDQGAEKGAGPVSVTEKRGSADAFIERYVVKAAKVPASGSRWAVAIAGGEQPDFPALNSAAGEALAEQNYKRVPGFRP